MNKDNGFLEIGNLAVHAFNFLSVICKVSIASGQFFFRIVLSTNSSRAMVSSRRNFCVYG